MYFISGYKLTQKLLTDKWKYADISELHSLWFKKVSDLWQDYMERYYSSHIKTFTLDQNGEEKDWVFMPFDKYNFKSFIWANELDNREGFEWAINDEMLERSLCNIFGDKDYQARDNAATIYAEFSADVEKYTESALLNDFGKFKGGY